MSWIGVVTNGGKSIVALSFAGTTLNIDGAGGGTGTISEAALMSQTALVTQKQTLSIIQNESVSGGIRLKVQITAPATGYILNQLGIWASLDGGASTLLALFQNSDGVSIPSSADMPDFIYTFFGVIEMSNEGTLTVTIDTSALISQSTMNTAITAHDEDESAHADLFTSAVSAAAADATAKADAAEAAAKLASVPTTRRINGKPLSEDVTLTGEDIGVSGKKVARFIIGTSTAGWSADDCDYLCDGTDDNVEINAAIAALPNTGGEIIILDGTYNLVAKIDVNKNNVSLRGNGGATILKRMWDSTSSEGVITLTSVTNCLICNLCVDGNKTVYTANYNSGIWLLSNCSNNTITANTCKNNYFGLYLTSNSNSNTISENNCNNNERNIMILSGDLNNISGNTCSAANHGIYLSSSSSNNISKNTLNCNTNFFLTQCNNNVFSGNKCIATSYCLYANDSNSNTITGNNFVNGMIATVFLTQCDTNVLTGNIFINGNKNIHLLNGCLNNTIVGNNCIRGTGEPSDYTSYLYTIYLEGAANNYNLIACNNCKGKAPVDDGGSGNILVNNLS